MRNCGDLFDDRVERIAQRVVDIAVERTAWAEPAGNPWATLPMAAIAAEVDMPAPARGFLLALFRDAGMHEIREPTCTRRSTRKTPRSTTR